MRQNPELIKVREDMKKLWKDVFHDSDRYINLLFNSYFNPDTCVWIYEGKELASALVGIPYSFESSRGELRGLYLCGLATNPGFRGRGLMSSLLEQVNKLAEKSGFDFTFLIPANEGLSKYYEDRGYSRAIRTVTERYTAGHNFYRDYAIAVKKGERRLQFSRLKKFEDLNGWKIVRNSSCRPDEDSDEDSRKEVVFPDFSRYELTKIDSSKVTEFSEIDDLGEEDFPKIINTENGTDTPDNMSDFIVSEMLSNAENIDNISKEECNEIGISEVYDFIHRNETKSRNLCLVHDEKNFSLVVDDILYSGGEIIVLSWPDYKIAAVVFLEIQADKIRVRRLVADCECSESRMLHEVASRWPELPIEVDCFIPEVAGRRVISDIYYGAADPKAENAPALGFAERVISSVSLARNYGMVRILDFSHFMEFVANHKGDLKFSIFVNLPDKGEVKHFISKKPSCLESETLSLDRLRRKGERPGEVPPIIFSEQQLQSLLLRKGERDDAVSIAFGLPSIDLSMALLLD